MEALIKLIKENFSQNKIACFLGAVIFIIFTIMLLEEYSYISFYQSIIFKLNGEGNSPLDIPNISPIVVAVIYLIGLAFILFSIKLHKLGYVTIAVDAIFAILILLLFKNELLHYPPFSTYGSADNLCGMAVTYICLSYLTIIGSIVFGVVWFIRLIIHFK